MKYIIRNAECGMRNWQCGMRNWLCGMWNIICGVMVMTILASCERRELTYDYYPYHDIEVNVDWSKFKGEKPTGVSVWVYPQDGSKALQFRSTNVDKVKIHAPKGTHDIVVFNQIPIDFGTIDFRETDKLSTLQVFATKDESQPWYKRSEGELVLRQPEAFATNIHRNLVITQEMVDKSWAMHTNTKPQDVAAITDSTHTTALYVTPTMATKRVKVKIGVKGIHNLRSLRAAIKQMSAGYNINERIENNVHSTSLLTEWKSSGGYGKGYITTEYDVFGFADQQPTSKAADYKKWKGTIFIEALLVDNKTVKTFNIPIDGAIMVNLLTGQIDILIDISIDEDKDLDLPDVKPEGGSSGGFDAEVENWDEEENVDLPV